MLTVIFVLLLLIFAAVCTGFYALVQQQGRILLRLDALELSAQPPSPAPPEASPEPEGLDVGTEFPEFAYPNPAGESVALSAFRQRRVLLVHWNFQCGFCDLLAPELAAMQSRLADANVAPVLIAYGDVASNQAGAAEHKLNCTILLMNDAAPPAPFAQRGTPVAYLLDEQGRVDAPFASGSDQVLALAKAVVEQHAAASQPQQPARHKLRLPGFLVGREVGLGDVIKGVTSSVGIKPCVGCERRADVLNRWLTFSGGSGEGLKAGTHAPLFQLPDLDGRMVSLASYRGRRVLLIFTDPQCGPCDELAPHLIALHQKHANNGLSLILVGRGDVEENRRKAEQHGYPFPVVVQPKWNLSKQYGTFATPVAFLIAEDGALAKDVAVGTDPILSLAQLGTD